MSSPSHHHQDQQSQEGFQGTSVSRIDVPCLIHGSIGVVVALALHFVGLFQKGDDRLIGWLLKPVFHGQMPEVVPFPLLLFVTAVFCFGLAFVILDTAGTGKRVIMGVTVLVLLIAMVPTLAVWDLYFSPFLPAVGVFWAWFTTMMYVNHNLMPCEASSTRVEILREKEEGSNSPPQKPRAQMNGVARVEKVEKKPPTLDRNQKYKPKEKVDG